MGIVISFGRVGAYFWIILIYYLIGRFMLFIGVSVLKNLLKYK